MFRLRDNAFAPRRPLIQGAIRKLPQAHVTAFQAANQHVFESVRGAADDEGLITDPIVMTGNGVDIADGERGDALFDHEFGSTNSAPNPVLRNAAARALPHASLIYNSTIRRELGI